MVVGSNLFNSIVAMEARSVAREAARNLASVAAWVMASVAGVAPAATTTAGADFFEQKIRPVLVEHCYECHSGTSTPVKGGLRLDSVSGILAGGEKGPDIVAGHPESSRLWKALAHQDPDLKMPHKKDRLPDAVVKDFERWIREGAVVPGAVETAGTTPSPSMAATTKAGAFDLIQRKARLSWIWETPHRHTPPGVKATQWPRSSVDQFILAGLEKAGLQPGPAAEPAIWLRRVSFALVGLPPTPEEVTEFLQDSSSGARERVVDRLLASPHFGERWGRHWLDLMRYAESRGHESDYIIPNAFEYRDYVIRAINADLPYNDFVREHLAGDLLSSPRHHLIEGFNESILGTGWAFLGEEIHAPVDTRQDENERIDNRIDVLTKSFLGLTVACARCHDHKFDAISQRDYYALAGFFISSNQRLARFETMDQERETARELDALKSRTMPKVAAGMVAVQSPILAQSPAYLSAAVEVARVGTGTNAPIPTAVPAGVRLRFADLPPDRRSAVEQVSSRRHLDGALLGQWTAALLEAARNPDDLLRPFAEVAELTGSDDQSRANRTNRKTQGDGSGHEGLSLPEGAQIRLNFGDRTNAWYADGVAFGLGPRATGDWEITAPWGTNRAGVRVLTRGGAYSVSDWRELDLKPGVEHEPTMYGGWKRDGVMVRSPKFQLTSGRLHYLVRGGVRVFAAVDSQRLVTGPVQTAQVREWGFENRWRWVSHDLSEYAGHRLEIEFSPGPEFDAAVARVVESETPPAAPESPVEALAHILRERSAGSLAAAAEVYRELFQKAAINGAAGLPRAFAAELRHWLVQRPELWSGREGEWPEPVAGIMREYLEARTQLLAGVSWKSRTAPALMDGNGVDEYLLARGKHQTPKGLVPRRFLESISGPAPMDAIRTSGRRELAEAIVDPANPLIARVLVNRVWHHLFGRGLVATVDNFGWLGQRPTDPELLDDLAATFVEEDGWSMKRLIRRLVLTQTYGMSSQPGDAATEQGDPENLLLHRMNLKRLEGEVIRDALLVVSGRFNPRMYGVSVPLHASQVMEARGLRSERGPLDGDGRRSVYVAARRNFLPPMMLAFDTPTPFTTVGRRNVSNVPGQMLFLMNDPFVHEQAEVWSRRLRSEFPGASETDRIRRLFLTLFGREPDAGEITRCQSTLRDVAQAAAEAKSAVEPWTELCHALFGVKEFIYVR